MPECQGRWQANYDNAVRLSMQQWQLWQSIVNSLPISESLVATITIILSPIYLLSPISNPRKISHVKIDVIITMLSYKIQIQLQQQQ
jgi:hypothetical protein